jgi:hypothetical protein
MTPIKPGGKCHKHEKASMTKPSLQHTEGPRKGQGKKKRWNHAMIEKRQEITGNATRKPLRPLMTSCKADPPRCMRRKSKVEMPMEMEMEMEMEMGKCMSHGVFRSETSRLGDVRATKSEPEEM